MTKSFSRTTKPLSLLACQAGIPSTPSASERDSHVAALCQRVAQSLQGRAPVDLIVLPELCTIEYGAHAFAHLDELAEPLVGISTEAFARLAQTTGAMVIFGLARSTERGYVISQVIVDRSGQVVACYDKMHLCHYGASSEKDYFHAGDKIVIFESNGWRIAPIICYDIRIPELSRTLAVEHGVDLLLHCGAYFRDESFSSWHHFAITRAMENQVYLLSLNRAGVDYGGSIFCPPWIDDDQPAQYFAGRDEDFRILKLDSDLLVQVRSRYTFLADRRSAYQP